MATKTPSDAEAIKQGCYFDPKPPERVREFLRKFCRQSIGPWAGKPLELMPWQWEQIIKPLYGWRNKDGSRRFRQAGIWLPKNQGKSTLCSGLSLYGLVGEGEQGAQIVSIAQTVEQAGIVFRGACDMVAQSPALEKVLWVRKNIKTIEYEKTRSTYKVMSGERGGGKHGFSVSLLIFDELAEQSDRELWDTMAHNVAKRPNSLLISISTAGFRRESIAYEQFLYAQRVLSGDIVDVSFLPVVYTAGPDDPWDSLDTFAKVNPSFGVTIEPSTVTALLTEAKNEPRKESAYRTLHLNQWVGTAQQWISTPAWEACGADYTEADFTGADAWVGWDYGYKHDLCSYCVMAERQGILYLFPRFFIPEKCAEQKESRDHVPYRHWSKTTRLYLTPGDVVDPPYVRSVLEEDSKRFNFVCVGYDPTGLEESRQICEQQYGWNMISVPQRPRTIGPAAAMFERLVLGNKLRHPRNPILTWCLENVTSKETPDGVMLTKGKGESQRIDGVMAGVIGIAAKLAVPEQERPYIMVL